MELKLNTGPKKRKIRTVTDKNNIRIKRADTNKNRIRHLSVVECSKTTATLYSSEERSIVQPNISFAAAATVTATATEKYSSSSNYHNKRNKILQSSSPQIRGISLLPSDKNRSSSKNSKSDSTAIQIIPFATSGNWWKIGNYDQVRELMSSSTKTKRSATIDNEPTKEQISLIKTDEEYLPEKEEMTNTATIDKGTKRKTTTTSTTTKQQRERGGGPPSWLELLGNIVGTSSGGGENDRRYYDNHQNLPLQHSNYYDRRINNNNICQEDRSAHIAHQQQQANATTIVPSSDAVGTAPYLTLDPTFTSSPQISYQQQQQQQLLQQRLNYPFSFPKRLPPPSSSYASHFHQHPQALAQGTQQEPAASSLLGGAFSSCIGIGGGGGCYANPYHYEEGLLRRKIQQQQQQQQQRQQILQREDETIVLDGAVDHNNTVDSSIGLSSSLGLVGGIAGGGDYYFSPASLDVEKELEESFQQGATFDEDGDSTTSGSGHKLQQSSNENSKRNNNKHQIHVGKDSNNADYDRGEHTIGSIVVDEEDLIMFPDIEPIYSATAGGGGSNFHVANINDSGNNNSTTVTPRGGSPSIIMKRVGEDFDGSHNNSDNMNMNMDEVTGNKKNNRKHLLSTTRKIYNNNSKKKLSKQKTKNNNNIINIYEDNNANHIYGNEVKFRAYQAENWTEKFEELLQYRKENGNCLVPNCHPENPALAQWTKRQRYQYKLKMEGKRSTITDERIRVLDDNGFVWDSHKAVWSERFKELKDFRELYGHCNVPSRFQTNHQLAIWVKRQRRQWKNKMDRQPNCMTDKRQEALESIGFVWDMKRPKIKKNLVAAAAPVAK